MSVIEGIKHDTFRDKVFGCILGSFIGDACGASLKYQRPPMQEEDLKQAM